MIIITPIFSFFTAIFGRFLTDVGLKFVAWKVLIFTFLTVTLPVVLKNFMTWLFDVLTSVVSGVDFGDIDSAVVNIGGLAGYFIDQFMIPDCLAIIISAIAIRFALNFIPFIK